MPRGAHVIHARMVGWSVIKHVRAGAIANAIGALIIMISQDGVFQTWHVMLAIVVHREHLVTLALVVGRTAMMCVQAKGIANVKNAAEIGSARQLVYKSGLSEHAI